MIGFAALIFSIVFALVNRADLTSFQAGMMILFGLFIMSLEYLTYRRNKDATGQGATKDS